VNSALSDDNPLDLIESDLIAGPIIQFGCTRTLVRGHRLGIFEGAAGFKIGRDAGRPEGVTANLNSRNEIRRRQGPLRR
jgi:hypothetical protein